MSDRADGNGRRSGSAAAGTAASGSANDDAAALRERVAALEAELGLSRKIQAALMARVERGADEGAGAFAVFAQAVTLEREVRARTEHLHTTQAELARSNRELTRARDAAESSSRAKAAFLAGMSHEVRTPLNGILGSLQLLLLEGEVPTRIRRELEVVQRSAEVLLELLNDVLDFSKLESGGATRVRGSVEPRRILDTVLEMHSAGAAEARIALFGSVGPDLPLVLDTDGAALRHLLVNLLGNAVKFTADGHVAVRIGSRAEDGRPGILLEVEDSGIGVPEAYRPRLFQPFTQADDGSTRRYAGTGLGLAICHQLCQANGGWIRYDERRDGGSVFRAWLPADPLEPPAALVAFHRGIAGRRVLILDPLVERGTALAAELRAAGAVAESRPCREPEPGFDPAAWDRILFLAGGSRRERCGACTPGGPDLDAWLKGTQTPVALSASLRDRCGAPARVTGGPTVLSCPLSRRDLWTWIATSGLPTAETGKATDTVVSRSGEAPRILLVEDHPINQRVARRALEKLGCEVLDAGNGVLALEVLLASPQVPDLVLMDCQMPEMDGYEATRRIREWEHGAGDGRRIPIVALTANALQGDRERCLAAGMDDFLGKPVRFQELEAAVRRWAGPASDQGSGPGAAGGSTPAAGG